MADSQTTSVATAGPVLFTHDGYRLYVFDGEPMMMDLDIGKRIGRKRAREIRDLIKDNLEDLEFYGLVRLVIAPIPQGGPSSRSRASPRGRSRRERHRTTRAPSPGSRACSGASRAPPGSPSSSRNPEKGSTRAEEPQRVTVMTDASADIAPAVPAATRNVMRANKRRDTGPEMKVRRWLHARGHRFRLDYAKLPGRPDIVLPRHRLAIFVHGCYWHAHGCGKGGRPKTNSQFWQAKFARNAERQARAEAAISQMGWTVIVVWECDLKDIDRAMIPVLTAIARPQEGQPAAEPKNTTWLERLGAMLRRLATAIGKS